MASALVTAACTNDVGTTGQPATDAFPPGVSTAAGAGVAGIYPANGETCCWLADVAKFTTSVPAGARTLNLLVFTPNVASTAKSGQVMKVVIDGKRVRDAKLTPGAASTVSVALPARPSAGDWPARIELRMSSSYVPKAAGLNADVRRLSVLLRSISAD